MESGINRTTDILEKLNKKPAKGILKTSSSFETTEAVKSHKSHADKATKWDEMNIIATLHPPDKDYGHMKIDEPKTPFEKEVPEDEMDSGVDPNILLEKIQTNIDKGGSPLKISLAEEEEDESEEDEVETEEEREARKAFEMKRKAHYNEFHAAKVARKLLELEEDDDDDDEQESVGNVGDDAVKNFGEQSQQNRPNSDSSFQPDCPMHESC